MPSQTKAAALLEENQKLRKRVRELEQAVPAKTDATGNDWVKCGVCGTTIKGVWERYDMPRKLRGPRLYRCETCFLEQEPYAVTPRAPFGRGTD